MKLDDVILDINRSISFQEQEVANLKARKFRLEQIKQDYPTAHYEHGAICLDGIWDKITCMRIERKRKYYSVSKINVKFLLGKKNSIDGMKIYTFPFENTIAEIRHIYTPIRKREIMLYDFKSFIPIECQKKNSFVKRIKLYLAQIITEDGLEINSGSFDKEEITKLILLK